MKINKKALEIIIQELQFKLDNLKEDEFLDSKTFNIIKIREKIPKNWYLDMTINEKELDILEKYFSKIDYLHYERRHAHQYYMCYSDNIKNNTNSSIFEGNHCLNDVINKYKCELITFEEFKIHIVDNSVNEMLL